MALVNIKGSYYWPRLRDYNASAFGNAMLADAAGEQIAMVGPTYWPEDGTATKTLTHLRYQTGTQTFGGSSQLRVSVQGVAAGSAAVPLRPNGTVAAHYTPAVGTGLPVSTWDRVALNTGISVARGEMLAVVWEFLTFTAGDAMRVQTPFSSSTRNRSLLADCLLYNGTSWSSQSVPNVILEFSDGTLGYFDGCNVPVNNAGTGSTYNSSSSGSGGLTNGNERGLEWVQDATVAIDAVWAVIRAEAVDAAFTILLYEGTTVLESWAVPAGLYSAITSSRLTDFPCTARRTLTAGNTYRLMLRADNSVNIRFDQVAFPDADVAALAAGDAAAGNSRTAPGAFGTAVDTTIPQMGVRVCAVDDGTGPDISGTHTISGVVYEDPAGTVPVVGATVRCIRQSDNGVLTTTTNGSGQYSFSVASGHLYHVVAEYNDGGQRHHWRSLFDLTPVAP